jgi:AcrR family transcriptional regulator
MKRRIRQRKQPVQARGQATTDALLDATLQVLVREGYPKLTTTRVAERAGVSVGTLYQYFPDKRSLVMALKVRYFGLMLSAVSEALESTKDDSPEVVLRGALGALLGVKRDHLELTKALRAPMAEAEGVSFLRDTLERFRALLGPYIARSIPRGRNAERCTAIALAALEGAMAHAVHQAPEWLGEKWFLDELVALASGYLAPDHTP